MKKLRTNQISTQKRLESKLQQASFNSKGNPVHAHEPEPVTPSSLQPRLRQEPFFFDKSSSRVISS